MLELEDIMIEDKPKPPKKKSKKSKKNKNTAKNTKNSVIKEEKTE